MDMPFFEMTEGVFYSISCHKFATEHETICLKLIDLKFDTIQIFHVIESRLFLKILIDYYIVFILTVLKKPKSWCFKGSFSWKMFRSLKRLIKIKRLLIFSLIDLYYSVQYATNYSLLNLNAVNKILSIHEIRV
jgi:hypothetical protein